MGERFYCVYKKGLPVPTKGFAPSLHHYTLIFPNKCLEKLFQSP